MYTCTTSTWYWDDRLCASDGDSRDNDQVGCGHSCRRTASATPSPFWLIYMERERERGDGYMHDVIYTLKPYIHREREGETVVLQEAFVVVIESPYRKLP